MTSLPGVPAIRSGPGVPTIDASAPKQRSVDGTGPPRSAIAVPPAAPSKSTATTTEM